MVFKDQQALLVQDGAVIRDPPQLKRVLKTIVSVVLPQHKMKCSALVGALATQDGCPLSPSQQPTLQPPQHPGHRQAEQR